MKGDILSSVDSAAYGAKSAGVQSVPHFPAPLSVEMARKLSQVHSCRIFSLETAGSAFAAALGSAAVGLRTFVPCSTPVSYEALAAPFMRLPFVTCNVSRSLHGPKPDHSIMFLRDAGYMMFFPETNQEIHDSVVLAYRIGEDSKVMLPSVINIDGLPSFMEPVQPGTEQAVKTFLPKFNATRLDVKKPVSFDIYSDNYQEGRLQLNKAMESAADLVNKVGEKWKQKFHRFHGLVDRYMTEDAETVIVIMGYHSATAKAAAKRMREQGKKVGVLRVRVFRPWPKAAVESVLQNAKRVLVFDQSVSVGIGGILKTHVGRGSSLICLGKYPGEKDFIDAVARVEKSEKDLRLWL